MLKRTIPTISKSNLIWNFQRVASFSSAEPLAQDQRPLVTITGISGYVGSQTCLAFLKDGGFRVRGTIRGRDSKRQIDLIRETFGEEYFSKIEIVEASLQNEVSLMYAIEDSKYVIHTAFPFLSKQVTNEDELIGPAVKATRTVLRASLASQVKRVVLTSSMAAIMNGSDYSKTHYTVDDWAVEEECDTMQKAKKISEKVAWEFVDNLPKGQQLELVTILPALILGPHINQREFTSCKFLRSFMMSDSDVKDGLPLIQQPYVDIRDVAKAHLQAVKVEEAGGKRFILAENFHFLKQIGKILKTKYGDDYKIVDHDASKIMFWLGSNVDKQINRMYSKWGKEISMDNQETIEVLGIDFIPFQETILEMADSLIEKGHVPDLRNK